MHLFFASIFYLFMLPIHGFGMRIIPKTYVSKSPKIKTTIKKRVKSSNQTRTYTIKNRFGTYTHTTRPNYSLISLKKGKASFYEHGHLTASGNLFDKNQFVAAHPTAKIPAIARIKRLDTGKTIYVIINDRGPFYPDRICDLSLGCAKELGFVKEGVTRVSITILPTQSKILAVRWRSFKGKRLPDDLFKVIHSSMRLKRYLDSRSFE